MKVTHRINGRVVSPLVFYPIAIFLIVGLVVVLGPFLLAIAVILMVVGMVVAMLFALGFVAGLYAQLHKAVTGHLPAWAEDDVQRTD